ncbi:DUF1127 domain-containing protein [Mesorhizobium sp. M0027]|uniref:DUF1127 domain-containing protein n=1 Tax=unclassified Mesorhizobium TaxID=325217 RepID=UPI003336B1B2
MNDIPTFASGQHKAARLAEVSRRHYSLATLQSIVATWREQTRFRWELKQKLKDNPHLIDDIGLTKRQAEEEIAKLPFWQR